MSEPVEQLPDIYDLWKAATADECPVCNGDLARTDAEHATAAAKGNADV